MIAVLYMVLVWGFTLKSKLIFIYFFFRLASFSSSKLYNMSVCLEEALKISNSLGNNLYVCFWVSPDYLLRRKLTRYITQERKNERSRNK